MSTELRDLDDGELVAAIARGDELAMAEALRRHRGQVIAFARRLVGDRERAEDIAQEVFVRLWERSSRFDAERGSLRGFLTAVTHGRAVDVMRSDSARQAREKRDAFRTRSPVLGVETGAVARTFTVSIRDAVAALPSGEREAIELAYFGGHTYRVVAGMLGEPEGTVKSRIRKGLGSLRASLAVQDVWGA